MKSSSRRLLCEDRLPVRPARLDIEIYDQQPDDIFERHISGWEMDFVQLAWADGGIGTRGRRAEVDVRVRQIDGSLRVPLVRDNFGQVTEVNRVHVSNSLDGPSPGRDFDIVSQHIVLLDP